MKDSTPSEALQRIIDSAERLGVEMDEADALKWLSAVGAGEADSDDVVVDVKAGVFGHRVSMLDFSDADLAHFRKIGKLVEFHDEPGVETALALSGSAAQSKIQTYPGDADFFERVNIHADTHDEACAILAHLVRDKALETLKGPGYELIEVKMGSHTQDLMRGDVSLPKDSPISWTAADVEAGKIEAEDTDGNPVTVSWEEAALDPGWTKLDWVVADTVHKSLVNASNMLDATWEAPDGSITPLDGYLDPYFQEIYLEADSIPVFTKLAKEVDGNALDEYVDQLEGEVRKYVHKSPNFGKAAKRMYNIFRLTGRYEEAAFLRELFDEPATVLYQVWSLIRTVDDCFTPGSSIELDSLLGQTDKLILSVISALEGEKEQEIVRELLQFRDFLSRENAHESLSPAAEAARAEVINLVNNFYYERLTGVDTIKIYMNELK